MGVRWFFWLRLVELDSRQRHDAGNHFLYRESCWNQLRCEQHADVDDERRFDNRRHARDIHLHIRKRINEGESGRNHHLHADRHQLRRRKHVDRRYYCDHRQQADD
jgi:hypothetical protein